MVNYILLNVASRRLLLLLCPNYMIIYSTRRVRFLLYDRPTIQYIYVCSKADEMASLI